MTAPRRPVTFNPGFDAFVVVLSVVNVILGTFISGPLALKVFLIVHGTLSLYLVARRIFTTLEELLARKPSGGGGGGGGPDDGERIIDRETGDVIQFKRAA